ncbi:N-acetyltransferase family protein [Lysobacter sp. 22409]|uniref:GNAT family N-acetyltransferase n=1 Tax=Lysobacter sp. 22409 TaxID=3453917 RepID=UPI003F86C35D
MTTQSLSASDVIGPDTPRWSDTLRDGRQVTIRPIAASDGAAEREFIERLSDQSRRFRFLGQTRRPSDAFIRQLTDIDYTHDVAFAAFDSADEGRIVGVSRYSTAQDGSQCECAVTVDDEWQNKGLGAVLMKHLIQVAKLRGIHRMYSVDSAENRQMHELAAYLGFRTVTDPDDASQVIHELTL